MKLLAPALAALFLAGVTVSGCVVQSGDPAPTTSDAEGLRVELADDAQGLRAVFRDATGEIVITAVRESGNIATRVHQGGTLLVEIITPDRQTFTDPQSVLSAGVVSTHRLLHAAGVSNERAALLRGSVAAATDQLFEATKELGGSQLRYGPMYLRAVLTSLKDANMTSDVPYAGTCTPCDDGGTSALHCQEEHGGGTAGGGTLNPEMALQMNCLPGTLGSDYGCCGNYSGLCQFCSNVCYYHDRACADCGHWYCGWQCSASPDNGNHYFCATPPSCLP